MPNNKINYITPEEYTTLLKHGLKYKGYVIGVGYAYITTAVIPPPTMDILNPPKFVPHGMDHYQHLKVQCLNTSDEAIKLSLKGNPEIEKDDIVEEVQASGDEANNHNKNCYNPSSLTYKTSIEYQTEYYSNFGQASWSIYKSSKYGNGRKDVTITNGSKISTSYQLTPNGDISFSPNNIGISFKVKGYFKFGVSNEGFNAGFELGGYGIEHTYNPSNNAKAYMIFILSTLSLQPEGYVPGSVLLNL